MPGKLGWRGVGMRVSVALVAALLVGMLPAAAQESAKGPAIPSPRATYAAMPVTQRVAVQTDLMWAGKYHGLPNGDITERDIAAIREFQKNNKSKQTGILNPQEREILAAAAKKEREAVGWRVTEDARSATRVGMPGKLLPQSAAQGKTGSRWNSARGEMAIETFRVKEPGTMLAAVFDQQKQEPSERKVESSQLRPDSFVISGMQGLKKFTVHGYLKNNEVRGLVVLYDQAVESTMGPLLPAIWSSFVPFPPGESAVAAKEPSGKGKVEYGTGIVASAEGHIVTPRHVVDGCDVIVVPGLSNAQVTADDQASGLALLRVYGNRDLVPLPLAGEPPSGNDLTLVGIADPQAQRGGSTASTAKARLGAASNGSNQRAVDPIPAQGFSGAAALDAKNRFAGMVQLKPQLFAGAGPANLPPPATVIAAETIRSFLDGHGVRPADGQCGVEPTKAAVVRVICVRK